jgi:drug/metabolite transporter (DMT)-like permease
LPLFHILAAPWRALSDTQKGITCMVLVTLCFASMDATAKELTRTYDPFFVVWARYTVHAVGAVLILAPFLGRLLKTEQLKLQILRSGLLFTATIFFFSGFAVMPLADVIAVAQIAPLIITALAALVLGEKVGPYRWAGVIAGFLGALVIVRPGGEGLGWAALLPIAGSFAFAAYSIATRFLGGRDSPWTTFLYTATVGALVASLAVPFVWQTPRLEDLPLFLLLGAFGAAGQAMVVAAFQYASASLLAPFLYLNLIWAACFGLFLFGEVPDVWTVAGAGIIVAAGLFVRYREQVRARRS